MTSTLKINTIEPEGATTTLTVGESGQNTVIAGAGIKANVAKDAGANAIFTSDGSGTLSGLNSGFGSAQVLLSTQTASSSASISFTSGIDNTYKEYVFEFINISPATDDKAFQFQAGSSYNTTITSTTFRPYHTESDASGLAYVAGEDQAQGTAFQSIGFSLSNQADSSGSGELHLFNPASTTFVKNFYSTFQYMANAPGSVEFFLGGYLNITSAITQVQFKFSSGNFDGTIKMYGIK